MNKPPKTVERIRSTGAFGQFPGAALASVEHDVYVLQSEAAAALAEAQAEIARLREALTSIAENPLHGELMMDVIKRKMHTARAALEPQAKDGS